jgi:hypothetical protein
MAVSNPELIVPDWSAPMNVRALATTCDGGSSTGNYATMNLGDHVGDDTATVAANRGLLVSSARLPAVPCWLQQVHGVRGINAATDSAGEAADWSWADQPGAVCAVMTADCLPVLMCDQDGTRVAAVHAGWRGLSAGIIERSVDGFTADGVDPHNILVWLGPAISQRAYEVDAVVRDAFTGRVPDCAAAFEATGPDHWHFDLYAAAREILNAVGVTRVWGGDFCTSSDPRFFSHRRQPGCGRQATLIWLENQS